MTEGVAQGVRLLAGRYQVGELIGRGGMADVHVGIDNRLGRRVAIKLLKPALATNPAFRSRFRREAQEAAKMAHATIVRIFDAGETELNVTAGSVGNTTVKYRAVCGDIKSQYSEPITITVAEEPVVP